VTGFRFGEPTHHGLLGGVRPGQLLLGAGGAVWAIIWIDLSPSGAGAAAGLTGLTLTIATATVPISGRTVEQWLPVAGGWLTARLTGQTKTVSPAAGAGVNVTIRTGRALVREPEPAPPASLRGVRIVGIDYRGGTVGAISERRGRRLTAVLVSRAPGFALADESEQQQRLAVWASVLGAAGHGAVRRIAWVQRSAPAQTDGLARWLHEQRDPDIPLHANRIADSYLELLEHSAQAVQENEVLLAIQVDQSRMRRDDRGQLQRTLVSACEQVAAGLERARVHTDRALTPGGLARALRVAYDPYLRGQLASLRAAGRVDELSEPHAWPSGMREGWGSYQTDGAWHATFAIAGWPRAEVGPAFLSPLLASSEHVRTVAVSFEPLDPRRSLRQAEGDVTREETDRRQRHHLGQLETARARQAQDATRRREAELAAGHSEVRLAGFLTVTGRDPDELERACEDTITLAARAHLELHRLYGQQAQAFTFTLPLCRGLK